MTAFTTLIERDSVEIRVLPRRDTVVGLFAGSTVLTLRGAVPVQELRKGDKVITRNGARKLLALSCTLQEAVDIVEIAPGALGHDRPELAMCLPADQKVHLRDWRAQALFGSAQATIEVSRLIDGEFIKAGKSEPQPLYELGFERDEIIYVDGMELLCRAAPQ